MFSSNRVWTQVGGRAVWWTGRFFRLKRALGFREPDEYNTATWVFLVMAFLMVMVLSAMRAQMLALALVRLVPFGVLVALMVQGQDISSTTRTGDSPPSFW